MRTGRRPDAIEIRDMLRLRRLGRSVTMIANQYDLEADYVNGLLDGRAFPKSRRAYRPRGMSDADWFWSRVERGVACWRWQGPTNPSGYGIYTVGAVTFLAHRYAYEVTEGSIPDGLMVLHSVKCTTRVCVRPDHLRPGTHADNMADVRAKNRLLLGMPTIEEELSTGLQSGSEHDDVGLIHEGLDALLG